MGQKSSLLFLPCLERNHSADGLERNHLIDGLETGLERSYLVNGLERGPYKFCGVQFRG